MHFSETKDLCEMFKIMKFCAIVLHVLVLVLAPLVLVLVLDDIVLATRLHESKRPLILIEAPRKFYSE